MKFKLQENPLELTIAQQGESTWSLVCQRIWETNRTWVFTTEEGSMMVMLEKQNGVWYITTRTSLRGMIQVDHTTIHDSYFQKVEDDLNRHLKWFQQCFNKQL